MGSGHDLGLYHCLGADHAAFPWRFKGLTERRLQEVGFGGGEVCAFGGSNYADGEGASSGLRGERVEYFVVVDEEVYV